MRLRSSAAPLVAAGSASKKVAERMPGMAAMAFSPSWRYRVRTASSRPATGTSRRVATAGAAPPAAALASVWESL
jgi:hypothetical protein